MPQSVAAIDATPFFISADVCSQPERARLHRGGQQLLQPPTSPSTGQPETPTVP
jgi:hypothetical protein